MSSTVHTGFLAIPATSAPFDTGAWLALAYFGVVVVLQGLLRFGTGAAQSQLVALVSPLAIAALFTPQRLGLQRLIDHRLYRRTYDANQTLVNFGHTLPDDVDLGQLSDGLQLVVEEAMQPEHISRWPRRSSERQR
jgi:hypothetical protein